MRFRILPMIAVLASIAVSACSSASSPAALSGPSSISAPVAQSADFAIRGSAMRDLPPVGNPNVSCPTTERLRLLPVSVNGGVVSIKWYPIYNVDRVVAAITRYDGDNTFVKVRDVTFDGADEVANELRGFKPGRYRATLWPVNRCGQPAGPQVLAEFSMDPGIERTPVPPLPQPPVCHEGEGLSARHACED